MWEADITCGGMFLDLASSSSRWRHTGIILEGGDINAGMELGETMALLLVVELQRRGPTMGLVVEITDPSMELRRWGG